MVQEYIVDASVLIQGFIRESDTPRVQTLLKGLFDTTDPVILHVPEFCLLECANILWKQAGFHGMSQADVRQSLTNLMSTPLIVQPVINLLPRALTIGLAHNLAFYDSVYIALGEKLGHSLITVDTRQSNAASAIGIALKSLYDFPKLKP